MVVVDYFARRGNKIPWLGHSRLTRPIREFGDTIGYAVGVCTHALSQQEGRHVAMCGNINKVSVNPNSMQSYCLEISAIYQAAPVSTSSLKRILLMLRIH
uniref:Uncharacterized protein n=1 Tax=Vespula pensylvanica TaxID=30213 RepID=A0A834P7M0_VESPE|nr:hypothetical protein H0235_004530 [Vespula pensylvanica]